MDVSERVKMASFGAGDRRKEIGQQHYIIFRVPRIRSFAVYRGRKGSMAALTQVLSGDPVLLGGEELEEGSTDKFQGQEIGDSAVGEYLNLKLDREEVPGRGRGE